VQHDIGFFQHNVQSVQFMEHVERKGKGWNLCLQTLDGILCHDGEIHEEYLKLYPKHNVNIGGVLTVDHDISKKLIFINQLKIDRTVKVIPTLSLVIGLAYKLR